MEGKIKYLFDTNIWLERLLNQEQSKIVGELLNKIPVNQIYISDFSLHSIGVILTKFNKSQTFLKFIRDLFFNAQIEQISLNPTELQELIKNIKDFKLDFDDAYQLTVSQKNNLTIITFDKDFNVEGIDKMSPKDLLNLP